MENSILSLKWAFIKKLWEIDAALNGPLLYTYESLIFFGYPRLVTSKQHMPYLQAFSSHVHSLIVKFLYGLENNDSQTLMEEMSKSFFMWCISGVNCKHACFLDQAFISIAKDTQENLELSQGWSLNELREN